jgi:hypothetical protein
LYHALLLGENSNLIDFPRCKSLFFSPLYAISKARFALACTARAARLRLPSTTFLISTRMRLIFQSCNLPFIFGL